MSTSARCKVLVTAPRALSNIARYEAELGAAGCDVIACHADERLEESQLLPLIVDIDAIICGDDRITRSVLNAATRLRVISKWGTGMDSIDVDYARRRGIVVCNTPGAFSEPVADTVLGYILLFARNLDRMTVDMRAGRWQRLPARALSDCTLGIVGLGDSGQAVARRAKACGMRIFACTVNRVSDAVLAELGVQLTDLPTLLSTSDFVTLHADLRPENRHLINSDNLRLMKPSAVLINTARGQLVDEPALIDALRNRRLAGAALDVFEEEPLPAASPLKGLENVYLAPHNANASVSATERVHQNTIGNVLRVLAPIKSNDGP